MSRRKKSSPRFQMKPAARFTARSCWRSSLRTASLSALVISSGLGEQAKNNLRSLRDFQVVETAGKNAEARWSNAWPGDDDRVSRPVGQAYFKRSSVVIVVVIALDLAADFAARGRSRMNVRVGVSVAQRTDEFFQP